MTIAIITPCAVKLSNGSGHHHSVRFGHHSCRPRNFNLSVSSSSGFAARRKILPVRRRHRSTSIRAVSENLGSLPDPLASSSNNRYHPSEDIKESAGDDSPLADADNARTLVEVNRKATLMFSGLTDDEIHENIIWPDLPS